MEILEFLLSWSLRFLVTTPGSTLKNNSWWCLGDHIWCRGSVPVQRVQGPATTMLRPLSAHLKVPAETQRQAGTGAKISKPTRIGAEQILRIPGGGGHIHQLAPWRHVIPSKAKTQRL